MTADRPDLPAFSSETLDTCNLVMKGGVTSGVVYPGTIRVLATRYRFRKIGGTSAGAIAAAFTAAAEYRRRAALQARAPEPHQSFEGIWKLGENLQEHLKDGRTRLESLFAPNVRTQPLSDLLSTALRPRGAVVRGLQALLGTFPAPTLTAALGGGLMGLAGVRSLGWVPGVLPSPADRSDWDRPAFHDARFQAVLGTSLLAWGGAWLATNVLRRTLRDLKANNYGLATGYEPGDETSETPRFTAWLHRELQGLAGTTSPLTFGDLSGPAPTGGQPDTSIDLRLITTCLTLGRPYVLPMDSGATDDKMFYFSPQEWRAYFPPTIIDFLKAKSERRISFDLKQKTDAEWPYYRLPSGPDLPVVVATRLSMSFPGLFSAVPMYSGGVIGREKADDPAARPSLTYREPREVTSGTTPPAPVSHTQAVLRPCLFSDGGLTSNFPLMLFDDVVPEHPTFGINLEYDQGPPRQRLPHIAEVDALKNPATINQDARARWRSQGNPVTSVLSFGLSILEAARGWFDNSLIPLPGYVERVAHVPLDAGQGGLNLRMEDTQIAALIGKGVAAGTLLLERFALGTRPAGWTWDTYKATRFITLATDLEALLCDFGTVYSSGGKPAVPNLTGVLMQSQPDPSQAVAGLVHLSTAQTQRVTELLTLGLMPPLFTPFRRLRGKRAVLKYRPIL